MTGTRYHYIYSTISYRIRPPAIPEPKPSQKHTQTHQNATKTTKNTPQTHQNRPNTPPNTPPPSPPLLDQRLFDAKKPAFSLIRPTWAPFKKIRMLDGPLTTPPGCTHCVHTPVHMCTHNTHTTHTQHTHNTLTTHNNSARTRCNHHDHEQIITQHEQLLTRSRWITLHNDKLYMKSLYKRA